MRKIPPDMERIFDKPGRKWTKAERDSVKVWLFEPQQLQFLLFKGLRYLGTPQNAEDAWGDFCARRLNQVKTPLDQVKTPLDRVIKKYDPAKGFRFWSYLLSQFQYFCLDEWKKVGRQNDRELALGGVKDEEGEAIELELVDEGLTPEEIVEQKEEMAKQNALLKALNECMNDLSKKRREVVHLFYFRGFSRRKAAERLNVTESAVKMGLHRARKSLRKCLEGKGWLS